MAGTIKGITIQIGADTTKLSSALNSANRAIKSTQSELRSMDRALKLEPGNTSVLTDKFNLLKERVAQSKEKVDQLKEAQRQLDAQGVDKNSDQYQALQREIDKAEVELRQFESELKAFGSVGAQQVAAVGSKFQEIGEKIGSVGKGMTTHITAPIMATGTASVAAFKEVHAGLETIIQKTGATGDALNDMEGIMRDMASEIPTDFETAGNAIGEVNTRFGLTGDELKKLSTQFVKFADLNDTDVTDSVDSVQKALSAFGLSAEDASGLLDRLNYVGQQTGVSVDSLTSGLVQNGTAFQEMGLSIDQSTTLMGQLEKSGANSETVLNGMRKALKNATKEGIPLDEALAQLQDTIINGTGSMDGLTAAYDLFGKSGDQIYGAIKNGTIDFNALGEAVADAGGSVADTFDETLTPMDDFQTSLNRIKVLGADVGKDVMPILEKALKKVATAVEKMSKVWNGMSPEMQETVVKIALIVAAIGPLLIVIGKMSTGIGAILKLAPQISGALSSLAGLFSSAAGGATGFSAALTFLTGPIGIAIAAIAGITAAVITLWNTNEDFRNTIKSIWSEVTVKFDEAQKKILKAINSLGFDFQSISDAIKAAWIGLCSIFVPVFEGTFKTITTVLKGFMDIIAGIIQVACGVIKGDWQMAWQGIVDIAKGIFNTLTAPIQGVLTAIGSFFGAKMSDIKTLVSTALEAIRSFFQTKLEAARTIATNILVAVATIFMGKLIYIKDLVSNTLESIRIFFQAKLESIRAFVASVLLVILNYFNARLHEIREVVSTVLEAIRNFFQSKLDAVRDTVMNVLVAIASFFVSKMNYIKHTVTEALDMVRSTFSSALNTAKSTADNILNGIKNVFTNTFNSIKSHVSGVVEWLKGIFNFEWRLPHIKLPHFSISGELDVFAGKVPSVSVDWYDKGGIFTHPSIIGVGEKRPEFVGALDDLRAIVREESGGGALMQEMVRLMTIMVEQGGRPITVNQEIYADSTSYSEQQKQAAREFRNIARALT